ncbi:MAG TPA: adenosylmethionine decarboxylase [Candidatus Paceibacterota bacterium]|nr:adenosylmethionine decarboxylase [Candidatus Paceibacterota bacterium]
MEKGKHLLYEAKVKNPEILKNKDATIEMFNRIIESLQMKAVSEVEVYQFPGGGGLTAFCVISESHLSIHTWPENNYMAFDIFSCRNFDENVALEILKEYIQPEKELIDVMVRGTDRFAEIIN